MKKYIWGSLILILISLVGVWWVMSKNGLFQSAQVKREEAINAIYPTVTTVKGGSKVTPTTKKATSSASQVVGQAGTKGGLNDDGTTQTIFDSVYSPDRKLYIEKEYSGTRYVLWRSDSKITVHVGNSWSWVHPRRELTETGVVSGHKTFTYDIRSQKIVDFAVGSKKYTIQCVHNGLSDVKAECDKFIANFKLI